MTIRIVLTQLSVLMTFLLLGYFIKRKGFIHDIGVKDMSWVIVNVGNPCQILSSVLNSDIVEDKSSVLLTFGICLASYAILIAIGLLMGRIVGASKDDRKFYNMMTVFGNLGFIGLPLVQAIYGENGVIYVVVFMLVYNLLMFTYGIYILRPTDRGRSVNRIQNLLNPGLIASLAAILFFFFDIRLPAYFNGVVYYGGQIVVFLAVFVIGANLADMDMRSVVSDRHVWIYLILRQVVIPVVLILICRNFITDKVLLGCLAICLSVPVGNVNSMVATNNGLDLEVLTKGTVLTTVLSILTISCVMLFV